MDVPRQLVAGFVIGKRAGRSEVAIVAEGLGDLSAQRRGRAEGESGAKASLLQQCAWPLPTGGHLDPSPFRGFAEVGCNFNVSRGGCSSFARSRSETQF